MNMPVREIANCKVVPATVRFPFSTAFTLLAALCLALSACSKHNEASSDESTVDPKATASAKVSSGYELGTKIDFGKSGKSEPFRVSGWSQTEPELTWTEGNSAVLSFPGIPTSGSLRLKATLVGFTHPPDLSAQPVEVRANGERIADWQVSDKAEFTAVIPATIQRPDGVLTIQFLLPKAISPKELGQSTDSRSLGVACFSLQLEKVL